MGVYDPTDEYDELDEPSEVSGIGEGRRKTLAAIDAKSSLDDPQSFGSIEEMLNAVREISLAHPDGRVYMAPPEDALDAIEAAYNDLPEEAQREYLNDHRLYVKIRAARNRFNDWMGKKRREQEMPSPVEAGPANYPADKARDTARYAREGREELDEAIGKIKSAARGAKQRALEAIGSSLAEHNEEKALDRAESVKEQLEPGDIVFNRDTRYGLVPWGVKRLNDKSVRLKRPHQSAGMEKPMSDGETYPEYDLTTVDYDSDFLTPTSRQEWREIDPDQADVEEELTQGYEPAIRYLMGDEWVDENLDLDETTETDMSDSNDTYDPTEEFADDRPQQDQLTEGSARAASDTESRVDEGGSEQFVDDRSGVYDRTEETDSTEQASLVSEEVEGQADLTGGQATEDPEYREPGPGAQEKALDRMAEGSWHPGVIRRGFDVTGSVANTIEEMGEDVSHVLKVEDNLDDLTEYPGIGESSAASIRETIPELESRGVTRHGLPAEDVDDDGDQDGGGHDEWADAVEYVREHYGDGVQDRHQLAADVKDFANDNDRPVTRAVDEGTMQSLIRYQDIPPGDVRTQMGNRMDEDEVEDSVEMLIDFADAGASRHDEETATPAQYQPWLSEVKGIGDATEGKIQDELGFLNLWGAKQAYEDRNKTDEWDRLVEILPTGDAKRNLLDEIDAGEMEGVESVTEQTVKEGIVEGLDVPEPWEIVDDHPDAERDDSILIEHPDGYLGEIWLREDGKWDVEYVDPSGTRRDGSGAFVESPQEAIDELVPHIKEVRAEERDRAAQQAEMEETDWPEEVGRFHLQRSDDDHAVYKTSYLRDTGPAGKIYGDDEFKINFYQDTRKYHTRASWWGLSTDGPTAKRKATIIEAAREEMQERTEELNRREEEAREKEHGEPEEDDGDDGADVGTYDPTKEWDPEAASEQAKEMAKERKRPLPEKEEQQLIEDRRFSGDTGDVFDKRELVGTGLSASDITDWPSQGAERDDPDEIEHHREIMGEIYDPSLEAETDRPYQVNLDPHEDIATTVLGYLRRDFHQQQEKQQEGFKYDFERDDISALIRRFNTGTIDQGLTEEELDILWAATAYFADQQGNSRDLSRLEDTLAGAEEAAEEDDMSTDSGEIYDPTEEHSETIDDDGDDVAGQVVVGERELDVPEPWDGWEEVHFISHSIDATPTRGTEAVYLGPDRRYSVVVEGTAVSNKWGITAYQHDEPIPEGADYNEMRYGGDSGSDNWRITWGNVVDDSAQSILEAELPTLDEVQDHFQEGAEEETANQDDGGYSVEEIDVGDQVDLSDGSQDREVVEVHPGDGTIEVPDAAGGTTEVTVDMVEEHHQTDDGPEEPELRAEEVRLGTLDAANEAREKYQEWLHPSDNRSMKTVRFKQDTPDDALDDVGSSALISSQEGKKYGQMALTDHERSELEDRRGWSWGTHGFHAMSSKAVLVEEGATPWLDYYSMDLEPIEHASVAEGGKEMAMKQGLTGPGETGMPDDSDVDMEEVAQTEDKGRGEACDHARDAAEDGYSDAAQFLIEECDWTEQQVEELLETSRAMGEEPAEIYDPTVDTDTGRSFEVWAREAEPEPPSEPSDDEILEIAPTSTTDELTGPALRALKKAWTGYKMARVDARESYREAEKYAAVINGIRSVNGQEPLDFQEIEGWEGGDVMPDDPTEEYPAPEGGRETMAEAVEHGHAAGAAQAVLSKFSAAASEAPYDPTEEL